MELLKHFSAEEYARALEDWSWTGADVLTPLGASPFGDVFLIGPDGIMMLDTLEGRLVPAFSTVEEMRSALATPEGQDRYLTAGLALAADRRGLTLEHPQVYAYVAPPVLGGPIAADNLHVMDFVVWLSIAGQLHRQIRDLPPGARVTGVAMEEPVPAGRTGWRTLFGRRTPRH
jgi:hypothetical protein